MDNCCSTDLDGVFTKLGPRRNLPPNTALRLTHVRERKLAVPPFRLFRVTFESLWVALILSVSVEFPEKRALLFLLICRPDLTAQDP